ncbi:MAG: hypothetical protein ACPGJS_17490 [Flammeovirgaceae bacterium]
MKAKIRQIKELIRNDKLKEAIDALLLLSSDKPLIDDAIVMASRSLNGLVAKEMEGTIGFEAAGQERNRISKALLKICTDLENYKNEPAQAAAHYLHQFAQGPMVEGHHISQRIVEAYATLINSTRALSVINEANQFRKQADPEDSTLIEAFDLPNPNQVPSMTFWLDAFHQARLHGPRMLAALLHVVPDAQFPNEAKEAKQKLMIYLKHFNKN